MQSFFAFNSRREVSLASAKEQARTMKLQKCKLVEQKKFLAGVLKVINRVTTKLWFFKDIVRNDSDHVLKVRLSGTPNVSAN